MNLTNKVVPALVAYTIDEKYTRYGVLTSIDKGLCTVINISTKDRHVVPPEMVLEFSYEGDYIQQRRDKRDWIKNIIARTNDGKVGRIEDIHLRSPYPEPTVTIQFSGNEYTSEVQLSSIEQFIGHLNINPECYR